MIYDDRKKIRPVTLKKKLSAFLIAFFLSCIQNGRERDREEEKMKTNGKAIHHTL